MVLTQDDFRKQAEFRYHLRRFLYSSEVHARAAGIHPSQYQLLLAIKGMPESAQPNVTTISERLLIESHSTVELVDRCVKKGLAERFRGSAGDKRHVFIRLTELGHEMVEKIALQNRQEIATALPVFLEFLSSLH